MQPTFTHCLNRRTAVYSMPADSEKTIVLIHGNSVHAGFFEPLMELLVQNGFNAVVFDLPGHGNSDKWNPEKYNTPNLLNLFLYVIKNYGVGEIGVVNLPYLQQLRFTNLWKNQIQIIPNCGHGFFIDNPKGTALVLAEFFNS